MAYESDAEDAQFLRDGEIASLLAKYDQIILGRCIARTRGSLDAEDVAQNVKLRLLAEFQRGKRYADVPYRVVVHNAIKWTLADYFAGRPTDVPLPDGWDVADEASGESSMSRYDLAQLFGTLPERTRRVVELRYLGGLEHDQIADELGMTRNAVDQALHRGHDKLREVMADG